MAIKIKFDITHNPEFPTFVLAKKNGDKLGQLNAESISLSDSTDKSEISFTVHKYLDGKKCNLWDEIIDFKLVYCLEWDMWFQISVELNESAEITKTVSCISLGQAELSQIMLYDIEINTENDIARDDYVMPTVLYNPEHPEASLLHRIMEKAPHYKISHVDNTIANEQRTFTFSDTSIVDACNSIGKEINCIFDFHSNTDENGKINRAISVYDLESNCNNCGYRGEYTGTCPKCGSTDINEGYGNDTAIFITADELANDIQLSTDTDSVKNCFKLEAGDDLMTATIRNCNPNGTDYLWYIPDKIRADMSEELNVRISNYDALYTYYQKEHIVSLSENKIKLYNELVTKYKKFNEELEQIDKNIIGYSSLTKAHYNTIDLATYLQSTLMPNVSISDISAQTEISKITSSNLSPVAVSDISHISSATADSAVLSMVKAVVDSRYSIKINSSSWDGINLTWTGSITITNYSDEEDTATSNTISIVVNDDYEKFVKQKIDKLLNKSNTEDLSISGLFEKTLDEFTDELKKYCLDSLVSFNDACQSCIDILIEQGIGDKQTWSGKDPNLYDDLYVPYKNKLSAIESEISLREKEIAVIIGAYDADGKLISEGLQTEIEKAKRTIQKALNFESYLGNELWLEFCAFRREDKYSNSNYISDGLSNAELFEKANEFIEKAQKEIFKSAELQHSIKTTLKNLLVIKKFEPLVKDFQIGNWLRIMVDDELYKLRLVSYSIDYNDLSNISVEFSDVVNAGSSVKSIQEILSRASSMATSYSSVQRQAEQGEKSNSTIKNWVSNGLDTTNTKIIGGADNQTQTWDEHGMLFKKYDAISDSYDDIQLKIVNSTLAITDDNWQTVKTAVGAYYYFHPETGKLTRAYGVNGETLVGKLILGEQLGIYSENNNLTFNKDGLEITNGTNSFKVNPNNDKLLNISHKTESGVEEDVFYIDKNGLLHISGDGSGLSLNASSVQLAWNNINKNIQFKDGELQIYNGINLVSKFCNSGSYFYEDGKFIGKIGTNKLGNDTTRGLVFDLEDDGQYIAWAAKDSIGDTAYNVKLLFYHYLDDSSNPTGRLYKDGLHLRSNFYVGSNLYIDDDVRTIVYKDNTDTTVGSGLYSENKSIVIQSGETGFECTKDGFIFNGVINCGSNIDMKGNTIINQSDVRLKKNISESNVKALSLLNQIELKEFNWIENDEYEPIGIIAQQLSDIIPELVYEDANTSKLSIKMVKFIPYIIKAIQELYQSNNYNVDELTPEQPCKSKCAYEDDIDLNDKIKFVNSLKSGLQKVRTEKVTEPIRIPINE